MRHRRRRRRSGDDEHENHERWLVSYADFITLLFAFFVVMYAISSVNDGKYRVLSDSLVTAFRSATQDGGGATVLTQPQMTTMVRPPPKRNQALQMRDREAQHMKKVAQSVSESMAQYATQGQVAVIETDRGITVEINDSLLFSPGRAELAPQAELAIRAVARVFAETNFPVTIEGHTDNVPISTPLFPSNWELSAVRATTVLRVMTLAGVPPARLTAIGYGDQRPVADNGSGEGRARNRRVAIQLEAAVPALPSAR